jgi:hypothetical protein
MRSLFLAFVACSQRILASYTAFTVVNESHCDLIRGEGTVVPGVWVESFPEVVSAGKAEWVEYRASTSIRQSESFYLSGVFALSCAGRDAGSVHFSLGDTVSDIVVNSAAVRLSDATGITELVLGDAAMRRG